VIDEGIGGNRVLNDSACYGQSALVRFVRDVLSQPHVKNVILLEGINDIRFSGMRDTGCHAPNDQGVSAAQIEAGYRSLITLTHARGVKIFAGTLTPSGDSTASEQVLRQAVNDWIRTSHAFDGVIDFARATEDPADPLFLNPAYNTGDDLHPNDLGHQAMADAIPLSLFR
jgi:lysophospholipase L1-like esterase